MDARHHNKDIKVVGKEGRVEGREGGKGRREGKEGRGGRIYPSRLALDGRLGVGCFRLASFVKG